MVGLTPGGSEVVKDGLIGSAFADKQYTVGEEETMTTFYLTQTVGVFQAIEPMVRSHRSFVLSMLAHDMPVSRGADGGLLKGDEAEGGDAAEQGKVKALVKEAAESGDSDLMADELDDVYLDAAGATLNVSYSCLDAGRTRITVTFPLKVGYLEWTYVKVCPAAPATDWDWGMAVEVGALGVAGIRPGGQGVTPREETELPRFFEGPDLDPQQGGRGSVMAPVGGGGPFESDWGQGGLDDGFGLAAQAQRLLVREVHDVEFQNDPSEAHLTPEDATFTDIRHIQVASTALKAKRREGDVFDKGVLTLKYSRPTQQSKPGQHAVVDSQVDRTSFFVVATRQLRLGQPAVIVPEEFARARRVVIDPRVTLRGNGTGGGVVSSGGTPVELVIDWQCRRGKGGFTPAYVSLPLEPQPVAGRVQFYLTKICAGDEEATRGAGRGWSMYAMILLGVACSVAAVMYFGLGREKELRILLADQLGRIRDGKPRDTLQRGEYTIVSQDPKNTART